MTEGESAPHVEHHALAMRACDRAKASICDLERSRLYSEALRHELEALGSAPRSHGLTRHIYTKSAAWIAANVAGSLSDYGLGQSPPREIAEQLFNVPGVRRK